MAEKKIKASYLHIRAGEAEKKKWGAQAEKEGRSLASWVRFVLNKKVG